MGVEWWWALKLARVIKHRVPGCHRQSQQRLKCSKAFQEVGSHKLTNSLPHCPLYEALVLIQVHVFCVFHDGCLEQWQGIEFYGCGNQLCVWELVFSQYVSKKSVIKNIFICFYMRFTRCTLTPKCYTQPQHTHTHSNSKHSTIKALLKARARTYFLSLKAPPVYSHLLYCYTSG